MDWQKTVDEILQAVKDCDERIDVADLEKPKPWGIDELSEFCTKNNLALWWDYDKQALVAKRVTL